MGHAIKSIHVQNMQAQKNVYIELPETGIIAWCGPNNNGKSIIVKVTTAILSGAIRQPSERKSLINKNALGGVIEYVRYDNTVLKVHIHREAAQTYAELLRADGEVVRRYLSDKTMDSLVAEFGFHYNKEHEVSLNVHNDEDKFLMVNTKHTTNWACLSPTYTDTYAEQAAERLEKTKAEAAAAVKALSSDLTASQTILDNLQIYNTEALAKKMATMEYLRANLSHFPTQPVPKVRPVPKVSILTLPVLPPKINYPLIIVLPTKFPNMKEVGHALKHIKEGVCPVCERKFLI